MTEEEIKELLKAQPIASLIRTEPGTVAILYSHIEEAGGDLSEVKQWSRSAEG